MISEYFHKTIEFLTSTEFLWGLLWVGVGVFAVDLLLLMETRWGQSKLMRKCIILSLLFHGLLIGYTKTLDLVTPNRTEQAAPVRIGLGDDRPVAGDPNAPRESIPFASNAKPWDVFPATPAAKPPTASIAAPITRKKAVQADSQLAQTVKLPAQPPSLADSKQSVAASTGSERLNAASPVASPTEGTAPAEVPEMYRLRTAGDHVAAAGGQGATTATEKAVKAALGWLASAQAADGRWSAAQFGAGRESMADGRQRPGAGANADTGITGLALLSMLASGNTHRDGDHRDAARRGLEFLMQSQAANGHLGGQGGIYEAMYCHAIATFALSEALGMTGEPALREPVQRAVNYTLAAQDKNTGGWRYQPGDPGDMSQLGWQFMAIKSAELAGLPMPDATRQGVMRFLQSVGSGTNGGLASYRPGERPTRTMTAEALFCWQLLGLPREHALAAEAVDFVSGELPGQREPNLYYWYYATLAMHQQQGDAWTRWNEALSKNLLAAQRTDGPEAGSWDPDATWGAYGGRIYSTALASLCLEAYYRYLPIYKQASAGRTSR